MIHVSLEKLGFKRMAAETSIYYTSADSDIGLSIIATVVDDFLIMAKNRMSMAEIKRRLRTVWTISDKGPAKWMLNLRIRRDRPAGLLKLDQSIYIKKKLRDFGIAHLPPKNLPMKPTLRLSSASCPTDPREIEEVSKLPYRSRTGGLNYLRLTRADMCCTNSVLSQFNKKWGRDHFDVTTHA